MTSYLLDPKSKHPHDYPHNWSAHIGSQLKIPPWLPTLLTSSYWIPSQNTTMITHTIDQLILDPKPKHPHDYPHNWSVHIGSQFKIPPWLPTLLTSSYWIPSLNTTMITHTIDQLILDPKSKHPHDYPHNWPAHSGSQLKIPPWLPTLLTSSYWIPSQNTTMITHTIDQLILDPKLKHPHDYPHYWPDHIGSQVKTRQSQSYKFKEYAKTLNCSILKKKTHYTQHTFQSYLIRCVNITWIWRIS